MKSKGKLTLNFKQLKIKYWKRLRECIIRRDSNRCQVCGSRKSDFDVDHCFSRVHQLLFFDPRNLTTLCKPCHFLKSKDKKDYVDRVKDVVRNREGKDIYDGLRLISNSIGKMEESVVREIVENMERQYPAPYIYGAKNSGNK